MKKKIFLTSIALIIILAIIGFMAYGYYHKVTLKAENPVVTMEIEDYGTVKIELYPEMAPNTVRNFIKLINEGYYDGLTFHRVEENLIQRWRCKPVMEQEQQIIQLKANFQKMVTKKIH